MIRLCGGSKDFQLHQCHVFNPKHMMAEILKLYRGSASLHLTFRNSQQLSPGFLRIFNGKKAQVSFVFIFIVSAVPGGEER